MEIRLNQIGIVTDSLIKINGLTVITGKNNSGKTTVGKALYSILDAVCDLKKKAMSDRDYYIYRKINDVSDLLDFLRIYQIQHSEDDNNAITDYPALRILESIDLRRELNQQNMSEFAQELLRELYTIDFDFLLQGYESDLYKRLLVRKNGATDDLLDALNNQKKRAIEIIEEAFEELDKDVGLVDYARESINQTLRVEFSNQIQPVSEQSENSIIELTEGENIYISLKIVDNKVLNDGTPVLFSTPFKKAYLIDNPFVIDELSERRFLSGRETDESKSFLNPNRIQPHNERVKNSLHSIRKLSVLEQTFLDHSLESVKNKIDAIIPGSFEFTSTGYYYVQNGNKLKMSNLATGSKLFSILKVLLEKGDINSETMLILDEPEAHLHPEWQNAFAEVIVLLVKEAGTKVLLTTHSPNFMLAIDANMRKYGIEEETNFYQTKFTENGLVEYQCANDDIGEIYAGFLKYLSEAKMIRNRFVRGY